MKCCKRCDKKYSDSLNFCEKCGNKISKFMIEKTTPKREVNNVDTKLFNQKFIIPIGLAVIATIVILWIVSSGSETESGSFIKVGKKCYTVQEPYTVQVPYTYSYKYSVVDFKCERLFNIQLGDYTHGSLTLSNTEDLGGTFIVNFNFITLDGTATVIDSKYLGGHTSQTFSTTFDSKSGQDVKCEYDVSPATETRYREEIRYNTVEKCE